jgi:hypothetical protein
MIENLMWLIAGVALGFIFEEIRYAPEDPEEERDDGRNDDGT